jgi:hypothetical protein
MAKLLLIIHLKAVLLVYRSYIDRLIAKQARSNNEQRKKDYRSVPGSAQAVNGLRLAARI